MPEHYDVVVASNLFILSDLGPACTGTIGIAPSANINPSGEFPQCLNLYMVLRRTYLARKLQSYRCDLGRCNDVAEFGYQST